MQHSSPQDGFSLLESLVAFTVLTMILLVSFEIFGSGTQRLNHAAEALTQQDKLQNAIARLEAGLPLNELGEGITVTLRPLTSEEINWSTQIPVHATVTLKDEAGETSLQTILLRDKGPTP